MHIPDGLLDLKTAGATAALSGTGVSIALSRLRHGLPRRKVPLMGLAAAFLFAAQLVNFPVAAGTSGHLVGAVLAAVLLGPSAAVVVMTAVLLVQCLLFADGGLLALGANVLNMGIVAVWSGHVVYRSLRRVLPGARGLLAAAAFASWCSIVLAAIACAAELSWSGVVAFRLAFPAMAGTHMLIGTGEAVITALVLTALLRTRPDLLELGPQPEGPSAGRQLAGAALAVVFGLLIFGVPLASSSPDGLERVAATLGFAGQQAGSWAGAPLSGYRVAGLGAAAATSLAGFVGTLVAFGLAHALAAALAPRQLRAHDSRPRA
jgi:cobalt/nickel transport system permease protein